jgi:Protein of unknown function (DUF3592)
MSVSKAKLPASLIVIMVIIGVVLLTMASIVAVGIVLVLRGGPLADQSRFTQAVPATITDVRRNKGEVSPSNAFHILTYEYEAKGHAYAGEVDIRNTGRTDKDPLTVCVDPAEPARHVALIKDGRKCGDDYLGSMTSTADQVD